MYITGLEASGLKGLSFAHQLQCCVLFTGPNFVGKSARLEAIRLALLGHVPELGKQNQAIFELSGGSAMRATIRFDDGKSFISRSLISEGGSVKAPLDSLMPLGFLEAPMPMLDPSQYFGLTDSERIQYVFGMMKMPDTFTANGIIADLRNLSLGENTEQTEKAKAEIIEAVISAFKQHTLSEALIGLTADKGVLKSLFAYANKRAKDTVGTLRVLSELKTRGAEATAETIQSVSAEMQRVAGELAAANHAAGALTRQQMEANRVAFRRRQIDEELALPSHDQTKDVEQLIAAVAELDAKLKKAKAMPKEDVDALEAEWDNLVNAEHNLGIDEKHLTAEIETVNQKVEALKRQTRCPLCQSKGKDWKKNLSDGYANQLAELVPKLATITDQTAELRKKVAKAKTAWDKAKTAYDARQTLLEERQGHQRSLESIKAAAAGARARRQALQEELASLRDSQPPSEAELNRAAETVIRLKRGHQVLSERHSALVKLQQDLIRAGEAAEEHRIAAAKVAVIKAVGALLKERQAGMIDVVFRDLMKVANYFTQDIMEHELVFQEGRIGYVKQGRFVSHKTFSGTQKAITYVAITAALTRDSPLRIALIDEFDMDAEVFPKMLTRLAGAVKEGIIDQVVVAHTEPPFMGGQIMLESDWQHIPLAAQKD